MIRRSFNKGLVALACSHVAASLPTMATAMSPSEPGEFVGLSLRETAKRARSIQGRTEVATLGGITRIVGFVYDTSGDIVLVGLRLPGWPQLTLDDLSVALNCRLKLGQWPMVSIDPDEATASTRTQRVSFKGIDRSAFGLSFYRSDVFLKNYSLGEVPEVAKVKAFRTLAGEAELLDARRRSNGPLAIRWVRASGGSTAEPELQQGKFTESGSDATRFWYFARDPRMLVRDGVFCIDELKIGVQIEAIDQPQAPAGQRSNALGAATAFASSVEQHLNVVATREPAVQRLKGLYDLVAIAEGILRIKPPLDLGYLVSDYPVTPVDIPRRHELIQAVGMIHRDGALDRVMTISGGISFESHLQWLNDGDVTPLRDIVLETWPSPDALCWSLPLNGWKIPNVHGLGKRDLEAASRPRLATRRPGFVVTTRSFAPERAAETMLNSRIHQAPAGLPSRAGTPSLPALPSMNTVPTTLPGGKKASVPASQLLTPPPPVQTSAFTPPQVNYFDKRGGVKIDIASIGVTQERSGELGTIERSILGGRPKSGGPGW